LPSLIGVTDGMMIAAVVAAALAGFAVAERVEKQQ
jgi:hypothetical protein